MSYIGNPIVSTDFPVDYASGNGSTTAFTLSVAPASVNSIDVQISGVSQSPQTYSVSGTTLTFSAAPPTGTNNIVVRHLGIAGSPNVPTVGWSEFASGTVMMFGQTTAPTGWTKITANNNAALRVVSGAASTGGTVDFTTAFASQTPAGSVSTSISAISGSVSTTVGSTTLSTSQIPSHNHDAVNDTASLTQGTIGLGGGDYCRSLYYRDAADGNGLRWGTNYSGGGGSHNHSGSSSFSFSSGTASSSFTGTAINLAVKYVDVIMATKD